MGFVWFWVLLMVFCVLRSAFWVLGSAFCVARGLFGGLM